MVSAKTVHGTRLLVTLRDKFVRTQLGGDEKVIQTRLGSGL